jgi:glycyl-tRNA synthetase beta subunit
MVDLLQRLRLSHGGVSVEGTPRRLAVLVSDLAAKQTDAESRMRGPPAKVGSDLACACAASQHNFIPADDHRHSPRQTAV